MDDLDQRLLALLRVNAREPVASLSRQLGVTRATIAARLEKLMETGTVVGFSVRVREFPDSSTVRAIALIEVEGRSTDSVIRRLRGLAEVEALHTTNGGWDLVADIRTDSLAGFDRVLGRIRSIEGVVNSETSLLLSSVLT
ncbi:Lrp/AsnC family transcriptional regulator [Nakamurella antarctica]|nr:Lrp/AsnC family transcriptional regulator [Nakamurella antarctica]